MGLIDPLRYYEIVTTAAEKIAPGCAAAVRRSFAALRAASPAEAQQTLGLCQAPTVSRKIMLSLAWAASGNLNDDCADRSASLDGMIWSSI